MSKLISVVLPVFNAEKYLKAALRSIFRQTYGNIEVIAINDGSIDKSLEILASYRDKRLKIINNSSNLKLVECLNAGIKLASGDLIARMDADDIASLDRFEKQIQYMNSNPDLGVLGTWFEFMNMNMLVKFPLSSDAIQSRLFHFNSLGHPTAMINRSVVGEDFFYKSEFEYAEDFELWNRLSRKYRIENWPENLLKYRIHKNQISSSFSNPQNRVVTAIRSSNLMQLGVAANDRNLKLLSELFESSKAKDVSLSKEAVEFGKYLVAQNNTKGPYPKKSFERFIFEHSTRNSRPIFQPKNMLAHRTRGVLRKIRNRLVRVLNTARHL